MTSVSPVTMASTIHTSDINGSTINSSVVASLQFNYDFSDMFDISVYSVDTGSMEAYTYIPLEDFCPEINFFNDDIRLANVLSFTTTSASESRMLDSTMKETSELSVAVSSLSAPVVHRSEPLPYCLQNSISGVIIERVDEFQPSQNPSEASELADDKSFESEPREEDTPIRLSSSVLIDLTGESNKQSVIPQETHIANAYDDSSLAGRRIKPKTSFGGSPR
ncbi:hypothetical protein BCON_0081g00420 [Botryotinia convoluta]|uniref:Uncharacterized protein n=1 Tax=Botryotinia convoluta TaxID=54673 RepID=A0A4Z1I3P0_9HELO|nr:hypothetical protein BCON_0081g00420 [Botryotinia convoluta]